MVPLLRLSLTTALLLAVAACASDPPPPPSADYAPPAPRRLDAKTQLETGRR